MADYFQLHILKQGVAVWNKWRASNPKIRPDLEVANLTGTDLRGADLKDADLGAADLRGADLRGADLRGADLRGADLGAADLRGADLGFANLTDADLRGADLGFANLTDADLGFANLTGSDHGVTIVTQGQLDSACIRKGGDPPALPEVLKPLQKVCAPRTQCPGNGVDKASRPAEQNDFRFLSHFSTHRGAAHKRRISRPRRKQESGLPRHWIR